MRYQAEKFGTGQERRVQVSFIIQGAVDTLLKIVKHQFVSVDNLVFNHFIIIVVVNKNSEYWDE